MSLGYELTEPTFEDDEQAFVAYFEATFIGRPTPAGRRRLTSDRRTWNGGRRVTLGSLWGNNATESFRCSIARANALGGYPAVYRFVESIRFQQNIASAS